MVVAAPVGWAAASPVRATGTLPSRRATAGHTTASKPTASSRRDKRVFTAGSFESEGSGWPDFQAGRAGRPARATGQRGWGAGPARRPGLVVVDGGVVRDRVVGHDVVDDGVVHDRVVVDDGGVVGVCGRGAGGGEDRGGDCGGGQGTLGHGSGV